MKIIFGGIILGGEGGGVVLGDHLGRSLWGINFGELFFRKVASRERSYWEITLGATGLILKRHFAGSFCGIILWGHFAGPFCGAVLWGHSVGSFGESSFGAIL